MLHATAPMHVETAETAAVTSDAPVSPPLPPPSEQPLVAAGNPPELVLESPHPGAPTEPAGTVAGGVKLDDGAAAAPTEESSARRLAAPAALPSAEPQPVPEELGEPVAGAAPSAPAEQPVVEPEREQSPEGSYEFLKQ